MTIMMMGTAEGQELKAPEKQMKFLEDMTPEERAAALHEKIGEVPPAGLINLGNTCYMNSTLQCLLHQSVFIQALVDELKKNDKKKECPTAI